MSERFLQTCKDRFAFANLFCMHLHLGSVCSNRVGNQSRMAYANANTQCESNFIKWYYLQFHLIDFKYIFVPSESEKKTTLECWGLWRINFAFASTIAWREQSLRSSFFPCRLCLFVSGVNASPRNGKHEHSSPCNFSKLFSIRFLVLVLAMKSDYNTNCRHKEACRGNIQKKESWRLKWRFKEPMFRIPGLTQLIETRLTLIELVTWPIWLEMVTFDGICLLLGCIINYLYKVTSIPR